MQDNNDHTFDTEAAFLDDSWTKMSALLDNDLPEGSPIPVPDNSRFYKRGAALLILLLVGTAALFYWNGDTDTLPTPDKTTDASREQNIASLDISNITSPATTTTEISSTEESNFSNEEMTIAATEKVNERALEKVNLINNTATNLAFAKIEVNNAETPAIVNPTEIESKQLDLSTIVLAKAQTEKIDAAAEIVAVPVGSITAVAQLNLASANQPLLQKEEDDFQTKRLIKVVPPAKKWTIGIMAGVQQEKINQGFGGFSGSVLLNRTLGKNFTLETGLTYSLTQFNNAELNNSPTQLLFSNENPNGQSGVEEYLTSDPYDISDANLPAPIQFGSASWLSIPVLLTYQPERRLRINMGVEYAHLLQANEQKIFNKAPYRKGDITDLIAGNNISALTGVTWFAQKNLAIDIRYQYGFTDLSKINPKFIEQTDTRAALQWSLVYYFNPTAQ